MLRSNHKFPNTADSRNGFTVIEMLLVIIIISILGTIAILTYRPFQTRTEVNTTADVLISNIRRAQILSQSAKNDSSWGVYIQNETITLFQGSSFASRDPSYDEPYIYRATISITGPTEIVFDKLTGLPQSNGDINLSINDELVRTITINEKGMIE